MGQEVSISSDVNVVRHIIRYDSKKRKSMRTRYMSSPLNDIKAIRKSPFAAIKANDANILCVIFCNSYENSPYALGDSALNDGIDTYHEMVSRNYETYLFHDTTKEQFKHVLTYVLSMHLRKLVIYYIGHGMSIRDNNSDESDGRDESIVCTNGTIVDDELSKIIMNNNTSNKLILISDCCHSGTIYDMPARNDIIAISACQDNQTAKQDWIDHKGNGIFTYYFWKYMREANDSKTIKEKMNVKLSPYQQKCVISCDTDEIL